MYTQHLTREYSVTPYARPQQYVSILPDKTKNPFKKHSIIDCSGYFTPSTLRYNNITRRRRKKKKMTIP